MNMALWLARGCAILMAATAVAGEGKRPLGVDQTIDEATHYLAPVNRFAPEDSIHHALQSYARRVQEQHQQKNEYAKYEEMTGLQRHAQHGTEQIEEKETYPDCHDTQQCIDDTPTDH